MKQKARFKNFGNIGYRSMNGRYIGIPKKKKPYRSISRVFCKSRVAVPG